MNQVNLTKNDINLILNAIDKEIDLCITKRNKNINIEKKLCDLTKIYNELQNTCNNWR